MVPIRSRACYHHGRSVPHWLETLSVKSWVEVLTVGVPAMGPRFTRRRFLKTMRAGATYLALTNAVGCDPGGRTSKVRSLDDARTGPLHFPKVRPLPGSSSAPPKGAYLGCARRLTPRPGRVPSGGAEGQVRDGYPGADFRFLRGRSSQTPFGTSSRYLQPVNPEA